MRGKSIVKLVRDERGAVAATYALSLTALVLIAGVGFDYGRVAAMDSELQNGADQAALAGATQLDGANDACLRAGAAARNLVTNTTVVANDSHAITIVPPTDCAGNSAVTFYDTYNKATDTGTLATSGPTAHFIKVTVATRSVDYAFTPLTGLIHGSSLASATAGLGSSVCKVPPMMICSPDPVNPFNALGKIGWGVQVTGHGNGQSGLGTTVSAWGPGDFGFLEVGSGQNSDLVKALAFKDVPLDCVPISGSKPNTGNPQALYDAINTRFDLYDFSGGNGTTLAPCLSGSCPAALNVVKDVIKQNANTNGNNACKLHNNGWHLPASNRQFWPKATANPNGSYNDTTHSASIDAIGLPRDLCHYASFGTACNGGASGRFGNGNWARTDYFLKNHSGGERPANPSTVTRYETYKWELAQNNMPYSLGPGDNQYGRPVCSTGTQNGVDRRVLTVAVAKNCSSLSGSSTAVVVDEWVDMFLVEPVVDGRGNGAVNDSIYMEIIGPSKLAGGGTSAAQLIRRDVPYLVN